jgi:hypothetical protein
MKIMDFLKNYLPQIFIGLGILLSFVGGLIIFVRTNEYNKEIEKKTKENITLSTEINELGKENKILISQNIEFTNLNGDLIKKNLKLIEQNIELSDNLTKQSKIINSNITGGDSFCYLHVFKNPRFENRFRLMLINEGNFAMSKIQIRIVNLNEFNTSEDFTLESLTKNTISVDELSGKMSQIIGEVDFNTKHNSINLNIFINARNGSFIQLLRIKKVGENWKYANRVKKEDDIIYEKISDEFPISENENIWE